MKLPRWLVRFLSDRLMERAKKTPYTHLDGYMNRYWLVPYVDKPAEFTDATFSENVGAVTWRRPIAKLLQKAGIAIRVHEILRSDDDRALHNHPWGYVTIILEEGYYEITEDHYGERSERMLPGRVLFRKAGDSHRLVLTEGTVARTLFITGRWQHGWGFFVDGQFVPWRDYLNKRK
jgi:quercetin dioxygenase-like cupin family protein